MRTRRMAIDAVCVALYVILSSAYCSVSVLGVLKFSFAAFPIFVISLLYGPADGLLVACVGALVEQLLSYGIGPTTILWMIPPVVRALMVGLYARRKGFDLNLRQTAMIVLVSSLVVTTLNTGAIYLDAKVWGYPDNLTYVVVAWRYLSSLILSVLYTLVTPAAVKLIRRGKIA